MKKRYLYIIIGIVVIGTAGYFLLLNSNGKEIKYRTEKISRGDVIVQVRATGTINPVQTVEVGSQVSGTISKIFVDFNTQVRKGQVIAVIDSTLLYASVKEARANYQRNQAQFNEAQRTLNRTKELSKRDLVSLADLDAATTTYESAAAQLQQTEAALDRAKLNLGYAVIRAPIDGVVISRDVDPGQTVAASLQTPKLFAIANDLKHMQVEASVDEADIGQIKAGQFVSFTVDAYAEEQFRGSVTQVRLSPVTVQNVVTYTVIIEVPNPDMKLRPGMTATVSILIDKRENALRVPTLALRFQPPQDAVEEVRDQKQEQPGEQKVGQTTAQAGQNQQEGRMKWRQRRDSSGERRSMGMGGMGRDDRQGRKMARVWIMDGTKNLKPIMVKTGLNDNRFVEIGDGELKEGDEVIIGMQTAEMTAGPTGQTSPFQQRQTGGGGRRGM